jgi:hypothetical protein
MADMSTYLSDVTADYTTVELNIAPQQIMVEEGQKQQYVHEYDDGDLDVITTAGSFFAVTIQWDWISDLDALAVMAFYDDANKGNGMNRSFYWHHPVDGNIYTVRFGSDIIPTDEVAKTGAKVIPPIVLRVEGNKP